MFTAHTLYPIALIIEWSIHERIIAFIGMKNTEDRSRNERQREIDEGNEGNKI